MNASVKWFVAIIIAGLISHVPFASAQYLIAQLVS